MKAILQKWGNSIGIRLPKTFLVELELDEGNEVEISLDKKKIQIRKPVPTLDELLEKITPETLHTEIDWGEPVGNEFKW